MKFLYIVGLTDLHISSTIETPIKIASDIFITNNKELITLLIPKNKIPIIGLLEYEFLTSGIPVIFHTGECLIEEASHIEVINFLRSSHSILFSLWMTRDCSVNCDTGYAIGLDNEALHSNSLNLDYSFSNGKNSLLTIDLSELESACALADVAFKGLKEQNTPSHTTLQKKTGRINISTYHLQMARSANDLAIKVSTYCSFFESLFSTTTTELSHQLSERIAFFLTNTPHERLDIFKKTKKAYGIRSKAVHGDIIQEKDLKDLVATSQHCDSIARKIYYNLLTSKETHKLFEGTNETIDNHMRNLIFGITSAV